MSYNRAMSKAAAYRTILALAAAVLGLGGAVAILAVRAGATPGGVAKADLAMSDPELRRAAVKELVSRGAGIWDTFADPAVGRLLQPFLKEKPANGVHVSSNSLGLRERPFALPKPAGVTRIVLLGDSFVMGQGVEAQERLGVFLERWLNDHAGAAHGPIEVLHVGASGWNLLAECTYVARQITPLAPDLVIQIGVRNDVDDNYGTRGFGELGNFDPLHASRGDGIFHARHPATALQSRLANWIAHGLDLESRERYGAAAAAIANLARLTEAAGGHYVFVDFFSGLSPVARHFLMHDLAPRQQAFLPSDLVGDARYCLSKEDAHWNRAGHELVAQLFASLITQRGLLPALALKPDPAADGVAAAWLPRAEREAAVEPDFTRVPDGRTLTPRLDFAHLDDERAAQVHGGLFLGEPGEVVVAPEAAVVLRDGGRTALAVRGKALGRHELDGTKVAVFVEEARVGEIVLSGAAAIDARFTVPAEIAARRFVSVRFRAADHVYAGEELRQHVVFRLSSIALE